MCKNFKPLFLILVAVNVFQPSKCSDLQRLVDRIDNIELILSGGKYTWEDINKLKISIEGLEERLNLTAIDTEYLLSRANLIESLENSVAQLTDFKLQTEEKLESISQSLLSLKEELEDEVALSASTRQHVSELDAIVRSLTGHGDDDQVDEVQLPMSCLDALKNGQLMSGEYTIQPESGGDPIKVYCDQETNGGGWIVFQRRQSDSDFYRNWMAYKGGFGDLDGNFWLGNENIHHLLSNDSRYELRVDLGDYDDNKAYAQYSEFMIGSESENFNLTVDGYTGNAGDALGYHNSQQFSTEDRDNDNSTKSCAKSYDGAWWYKDCHLCNLNGLYNTNKHSWDSRSVTWWHWKKYYPLKFTEMKFREHFQN